MKFLDALKPAPLKLHTRTTVLVSAVLVAVFTVMAYFTNLAITSLSEQQEQEQAQLVATRISDAVQHHIKREQRLGTKRAPREPGPVEMNWKEVREEIVETVTRSSPELVRARIFSRTGPSGPQEMVRMPDDGGPPSSADVLNASEELGIAKVTSTSERGQTRFISAVAPVSTSIENRGLTQIGSVVVTLAFDQSSSQAAALRSLMWPLMALAIVSITLITYYLFRHIVYRPIDNLLLAMSKAEAGDLEWEVEATAPDEIGLLTAQFNRMLARVREVTGQLGLEQRRLEERVHLATAEIAERKELLEDANLRLFEMQRQLALLERFAAAGQLAAQFAHEVGTPLNLISGHVQLLRARATDERTTHRLDIISGQIGRITGIVRSLLDSTRKPSPHFSPTGINPLLGQILEAAQPTLVARNIE
ncbi:MAG TPA: histidine kinase dimerization/phospho-acceptor domain-containing protein, partial [Blastocatellia bacterium]|nr:histidine kinase dimerization/phospho-acceptor domain-containing protein [Blastocatellia bacterium]